MTTGVPNHAFTQSHLRENLAFFEEYHLAVRHPSHSGQGLDELKATHGREAVDVMLHVVAQTMKHTLRPDGFLGRWGERSVSGNRHQLRTAELERAAQNVQKIVEWFRHSVVG